jgi:hypothetical protein
VASSRGRRRACECFFSFSAREVVRSYARGPRTTCTGTRRASRDRTPTGEGGSNLRKPSAGGAFLRLGERAYARIGSVRQHPRGLEFLGAERAPPVVANGNSTVTTIRLSRRHRRQFRQRKMEPLWSPVVATSRNRSQIGWARKPQKQAKTIAVGCHPLLKEAHGKEGSSTQTQAPPSPAAPLTIASRSVASPPTEPGMKRPRTFARRAVLTLDAVSYPRPGRKP